MEAKIKDLDLTIPLSAAGSLGKHLQNGFTLANPKGGFVALKRALDKPIGEAKIGTVRVGFEFEEEAELGENQDLEFEAGASAGISLYQAGKTVLTGGDFGEEGELKTPEGKTYLGVDFEASVGGGVSGERGDLSFGVKAGKEIRLANYRPFRASQKLRSAVARGFDRFAIPSSVGELAAFLKEFENKSAFSAEGEGRLEFSGGASFSSTGVPFATADVPLADAEFAASTAGSVSVSASFVMEANYELRVISLSNTTCRLGYFKRDAREFSLELSAEAGVSGSVGSRDVLGTVVDALSKEPEIDKEFLAKAKISKKRLASLESIVKTAYDEELKASVSYAFRKLKADEAAFLFELDLPKLNAAAKRAVNDALRGDLKLITSARTPLPGVTVKHTVFRTIKETGHTFKFNLFGIFNYASVVDFILKSEIVPDPLGRGLLIVDSAEVERRGALITGGIADAKRIQKMRAEDSVMTAAYLVCRGIRDAPELTYEHWHFRYWREANRDRMKNLLDVPVALKMLEEGRLREELTEDLQEFGQCATSLQSNYDKRQLLSLFVANGAPRTESDYERIGRDALKLLYKRGDKHSAAVRRLASDDNLWKRLKANPAGEKILKILEREGLPARGYTDYQGIVGWAAAMAGLAEAVADVTDYIKSKTKGVPVLIKGQAEPPEIQDKEFRKRRERLQKKMKRAAKKVKATFDEPWGIVAMDVAARRQANVCLRILSDELPTKIFSRPEGRCAKLAKLVEDEDA